MERSLAEEKWNDVSEIYWVLFFNTNELTISISGKFSMPMIIEGNTIVYFDEFEILL